MAIYRLSRTAEEDILGIFLTGLEQFGVAQAEQYHADLEAAFAFLADYPRAARERTEIGPPIRAHPRGSHMIIYEIDGDGIVILRVRHQREDWVSGPLDRDN